MIFSSVCKQVVLCSGVVLFCVLLYAEFFCLPVFFCIAVIFYAVISVYSVLLCDVSSCKKHSFVNFLATIGMISKETDKQISINCP